jgi:branched-chain amino acid transport system substrate-binding protein
MPRAERGTRVVEGRTVKFQRVAEYIHELSRKMGMTVILRRLGFLAALALAWTLPAGAVEPIKVGFSMALTGGTASIGKQILLTLQIWRDDINAQGGLLGRPIELVYYDDQTNPAMVPAIYAKLLDVDKVDLLIGPYGTNMVTPAIPVIMQHDMTTIGIMANAANSQFHYPRYFSMLSAGPEPKRSFSTGFLELAAAQSPKPRTLAIVGADAEYARNATDGARENAKAFGMEIVYDRSYPPSTTDYAPIVRAVQAVSPDIVYVSSYPPDSVGIIRAASEIGLAPKMFGGAMVGPQITAVKTQLGPLLNGLINIDTFSIARTKAPEAAALLAKYQAQAPALGLDPLGFTFPPYAYSAGQVLADAVRATHSLDHGVIADYIRSHRFHTIVADIGFGKDGEWDKSGAGFSQFQNITGNDLDQFRDPRHLVVLWPEAMKTGTIIYPYDEARLK